MNAPLKLDEVKVGMFVSLNTKDAPSSYIRDLHGCRGQIEVLGTKRIQVRVTDKSLIVHWVALPPEMLIRRLM